MSEKKSSPVVPVTLSLVLTGIVLFVLYQGLLVKQDCTGIDKIYLYCKLHPLNFLKAMGLVLIVSGTAFTDWFWIFRRDGMEERGWVNWIGIVAIGLGMAIIWL